MTRGGKPTARCSTPRPSDLTLLLFDSLRRRCTAGCRDPTDPGTTAAAAHRKAESVPGGLHARFVESPIPVLHAAQLRFALPAREPSALRTTPATAIPAGT